jgi:hypothetical protein
MLEKGRHFDRKAQSKPKPGSWHEAFEQHS